MLKAVLFDLDGTLLPMDQDEFTKIYLSHMTKKMAAYGLESKQLLDNLWHGTFAMVRNDGSMTNEEAFWKDFSECYGRDMIEFLPIFQDFYGNEFANARVVCRPDPIAAGIVRKLKKNGIRTILATNPLFPRVATDLRISWTGLSREDFDLVTTYEDSHYCKPNPDYYREILTKCGLSPDECIMVGNDVDEDMSTVDLGMKGYLVTDYLINRKGKDIDRYPHGTLKEMVEYLEKEFDLN